MNDVLFVVAPEEMYNCYFPIKSETILFIPLRYMIIKRKHSLGEDNMSLLKVNILTQIYRPILKKKAKT